MNKIRNKHCQFASNNSEKQQHRGRVACPFLATFFTSQPSSLIPAPSTLIIGISHPLHSSHPLHYLHLSPLSSPLANLCTLAILCTLATLCPLHTLSTLTTLFNYLSEAQHHLLRSLRNCSLSPRSILLSRSVSFRPCSTACLNVDIATRSFNTNGSAKLTSVPYTILGQNATPVTPSSTLIGHALNIWTTKTTEALIAMIDSIARLATATLPLKRRRIST